MHRLRHFFLIFLIWMSTSAQETSDTGQRLGMFELFAGYDGRLNALRSVTDTSQGIQYSSQYKWSTYQGGFVRIQQSFASMLLYHPDRKWQFSDVIVGELSTGYVHSHLPPIASGSLSRYNFELGLAILHRRSSKTDIMMSLSLFKFGRELLSTFRAGSNYMMRARYARHIGELAIVSENKLYFGAFNFLQEGSNLAKLWLGYRYIVKSNTQWGIRVEYLPLEGPWKSGFGLERAWSWRLYYGINL